MARVTGERLRGDGEREGEKRWRKRTVSPRPKHVKCAAGAGTITKAIRGEGDLSATMGMLGGKGLGLGGELVRELRREDGRLESREGLDD
eukprot:scaffold192916_cov31-Tisochrysis_lutea.AAC.3